MLDSLSERGGRELVLQKHETRISGAVKGLAAGVLSLGLAGLIAVAVYNVNIYFAGQPEKAAKAVAVLFGLLALTPSGLYLAARRAESRLDELGVLLTGSVAILLAANYLFYASYYIALPADIVIWSESDYVNDILKFRVGYPIFTAQVNNESFTYVPGSQIVTYFLAWAAGRPLSIPAFRVIQLGYTLLAAIVAFLCCRRLVLLTNSSAKRIAVSPFFSAASFCLLFLIAANSITNPFSHLLHNDALAQLVTITAFWVLLEYAITGDRRIFLLMIFIPAVGFWVKQSLVIWILLYGSYFLIFERPRPWSRFLVFGAASSFAVLVSVLIGYVLWRDDFVYWAFTVLGAHGVSPLRSFRNLMIVWPYFVIGLIGGGALMRTREGQRLIGPWFIWLAIISIETYTSGIAWMTNHIGPGSLIAGVFFIAAVAGFWSKVSDFTLRSARAYQLSFAAICIASLCLMFGGLGLVRIPVPPFSEQDATRYIHQIENEFAGLPPEDVLQDVGSWVYLRDGVVMKDRAPSIGERGLSETGNFSGMIGRLNARIYKKILVRNFHSGDFWYDHEIWPRSSGIRQAMNENYREAGRIPAVSGMAPADLPYGFNEISVLVPRDR